jgi:DNA-binding GntR family transcriptional regulator
MSSFATMDSAQSVYAALRARLAEGKHAPGDRLTEVELASELGVSRTPVREALRRLQADGLVSRAGRGVVVSGLTEKERVDLFRVRAVLEALAASSAAERQRDGALAPNVLRRLYESASAIETAVAGGDPRVVAQRNFEFHRQIVEAADNAALEEFLDRVWDRIAVATVSNLSDPAWSRQISAQHDAVIAAIEAGNPDAAGIAMCAHIHAAVNQNIRHTAQ